MSQSENGRDTARVQVTTATGIGGRGNIRESRSSYQVQESQQHTGGGGGEGEK